MNSGKNSNNDSCRDLSGRRLSTIKEAKKLAEHVESSHLREQAATQTTKAKLEALEKSLGMTSGPSNAAAGSLKPGKAEEVDLVKVAQKRHRFDDNEYLEQSREINETVRSAVSAGLLKKRKKAKVPDTAAEATAVEGKGKAPEASVVVAASA